MIKIAGLSKTFAGSEKGTIVEAVKDLTLEVAEGEVFGFLGPNGAGKTTTVRMLCALIAPTSGSASVNGHTLGRDDQAIRRTVGILTETPGLYDRLSAEANLKVFAELYDVPDPDAAVKRYLLAGARDQDHGDIGQIGLGFEGMQQLQAIELRHHQVGDDQVGHVGACARQDVERCSVQAQTMAFMTQDQLDQAPDGGIVIDDDDMPWRDHAVRLPPK